MCPPSAAAGRQVVDSSIDLICGVYSAEASPGAVVAHPAPALETRAQIPQEPKCVYFLFTASATLIPIRVDNDNDDGHFSCLMRQTRRSP